MFFLKSGRSQDKATDEWWWVWQIFALQKCLLIISQGSCKANMFFSYFQTCSILNQITCRSVGLQTAAIGRTYYFLLTSECICFSDTRLVCFDSCNQLSQNSNLPLADCCSSSSHWKWMVSSLINEGLYNALEAGYASVRESSALSSNCKVPSSVSVWGVWVLLWVLHIWKLHFWGYHS